jgi:hypothetical protein
LLLHQRPSWAWPAYIAALPEASQVPVASIIWWDYFSQRVSAHRRSELDHWINQKMPEHEDLQATIAGLVAVGFTARRARQRVFKNRLSCPWLQPRREKDMGREGERETAGGERKTA